MYSNSYEAISISSGFMREYENTLENATIVLEKAEEAMNEYDEQQLEYQAAMYEEGIDHMPEFDKKDEPKTDSPIGDKPTADKSEMQNEQQ